MQDTLQLFTAQNGQLSAKVIFPDATTRHIHSLVDPAVEGAFYEDTLLWGNVIVFAATGLGYHITASLQAIPEDAVIVAFDYYEALIDHCRKNIFSKIKNIVLSFSDINASGKAAEIAAVIGGMPSVKIQVIKHPASFDMHRDFYESGLETLFAAAGKISEKQHASPRTDKCRPLVMYGNFFLEKEILAAFTTTAAAPERFPYNDFTSPLAYENALLRSIQEIRPPFIFSINMKGIDAGGIFAKVAERFDIPVIIWFVDDPRRIFAKQLCPSASDGGMPSCKMIAACWERAYLPWLKRAGFAAALYLPLATDLSLFHAKRGGSPSIELGFVGTSMVDEFSGKIKEKFLWSDRLSPLVHEASENLLANPDYDVDGDIVACAKRLSIELPFSDAKNISWLCAYSIHFASMKKRRKTIGGLIEEGIELFGDAPGWKNVLGPSIKAHPDIDYRHGLRDIYADIRINVNVTSCQMPSAVNQRVFDIPCAGSFVLSDNQKDLCELFEIGKEAIVYGDIEDLKDKIRFYKTHEAERVKIIAAAHKRILADHTYGKRIEKLLHAVSISLA
jgi:spore maturation protein CgeB